MADPRAFTLLELVAVILVLVIGVWLLMPRMPGPARNMQNNTQLRVIHQTMFMYGQGNNQYFPGLNLDGSDADLSVEGRMQLLLDANYFPGEYAISPVEVKTAWTTGPVTTANYSYAMLQIPAAGERRKEWFETLNSDAAILSDRNVGAAASPLSVHAKAATNVQRKSHPWRPFSGGSGPRLYSGAGWRGSVVYNDNHVVFESTDILSTQYGAANPNKADKLFTAAGDDDAFMIYTGN